MTGRGQANLDDAVRAVGGNAIGIQGDVSNLNDLDRLYAEVARHAGRIDILCANAGGGEFRRLEEVTEDHFDRTFDGNVKGMVFTVQKALPLLRDGASVILTGSTAGSNGTPAFSVYSATRRRCATLRGAGCLNSRPPPSGSTSSRLARRRSRAGMGSPRPKRRI